MQLQTGIFSDLLRKERDSTLARLSETVSGQSATPYEQMVDLGVIGLRTSLENPATPLSYPAEWLLDIFNGGRTDSGIRVSELTALQVSDVYSCVDLIAGTIACLPLHVYERIQVGETGMERYAKRLAVEHAYYDLIAESPNDEMSAYIFKKTLMAHALLWGNGYAEIQRNGAGEAVALWPRSPQRTRPVRITASSRLIYKTSDGIWEPWQSADQSNAVPERVIPTENMIHILGLSLDGRIAQDVIELARQLVGLSLANEKYAAKFFGNGAIPDGVLTVPHKLPPVQREGVKRSWNEAYGGENIHRTALLENGVTYTKIGSTPSEAQMLEARKWNKIQVGTVFHVPISMLNIPGMNRASAEQQGLEFVNYTLQPWVVCWEQELNRKLLARRKFGRSAGRRFIAIIDTRGLTLPDAKSKKEFYSAGRQWGFLNAQDIREMEDLNPISGEAAKNAEAYWTPVNMAEGAVEAAAGGAGKGLPITSAAQGQKKGAKDTPPIQEQKFPPLIDEARIKSILLRPVEDAARRFMARKDHDFKAFQRTFEPITAALLQFKTDSNLTVEGELRRLYGDIIYWTNENCSSRAVTSFFTARFDAQKSTLYLARHGETENDSEGKSDDFIPEEPLNENGKEQAALLAAYIEGHVNLSSIYCGTPRRHVQTADIVSVGAEHAAVTARAEFDTQGKDETDAAFQARIVGALNALGRDLGGPALIVTSHKGIEAYLKCIRQDQGGVKGSTIPFCGLYQVATDGKDASLIFQPGV